MTDAEAIEKCVTTFKLFKRFAEADQIKTNGKRMSLRDAITFEANAAISKLEKHIGYKAPGPGLWDN